MRYFWNHPGTFVLRLGCSHKFLVSDRVDASGVLQVVFRLVKRPECTSVELAMRFDEVSAGYGCSLVWDRSTI